MKIGYLGIKGSNSEAVASSAYDGDLQGYRTIPSLFRALSSGQAKKCVIPIENSVEGPVGITNDMLYRDDVCIVAEHYRKITHCLISRPGNDISDIDTVISHPQAIGQCSTFIEDHDLKAIPFPDTATSVASLEDEKYRNCAAIADERAAGIYGMKILERDIGDFKENFTRFVTVEKGSWKIPETGNDLKMSVVASASDSPGSLMRILKVYSSYGINLTKIESRPVKFEPWNYIFFLDSECGSDISGVTAALQEITDLFKVIGVYPRAGLGKN